MQGKAYTMNNEQSLKQSFLVAFQFALFCQSAYLYVHDQLKTPVLPNLEANLRTI